MVAAGDFLEMELRECLRDKEWPILDFRLGASGLGRRSLAMLVVLVSCHRASSSFIDRTLRNTSGEFRLSSDSDRKPSSVSSSSSSAVGSETAKRDCLRVSAKRAISSCCLMDSGSLNGGGGTCKGKTSVKKSADKKLRKADGVCSYVMKLEKKK